MSDYQLWNELGNVYIISGELEQAINAYKKALDLNPKSGWAHNNIALAYIRLAEPEKAIEHYQRSIELLDGFSDKAEAWHRLGSAYEMLGDIKNTLLAFERSTALAPEKDEYQASLASALKKLPDDVQDIKEIEPQIQTESKLETAPLIDRTIPSIPDDIKRNLIPIEGNEEINLDPGVEALMDELSKELELDINGAIEALEDKERATAEKEPLPTSEPTPKPKWLEADDDEEAQEIELNKTDDQSSNESLELKLKEYSSETKDSVVEDKEVTSVFEKDESNDVDELAIKLIVEDLDVEDDDIDDEDDVEEFDEYESAEAEEFEFQLDNEELDSDDDKEEEEELFDEDDENYDEVVVSETAPEILAEETVSVSSINDAHNAALQNASVWGEMGNIFFDSDIYDGALIAYQKALELDSKYGPVIHNLGLLHMQRGEYEKAAEFYQMSIDLLEDQAAKIISWNNLGNAYRAMRNYEQASDAYRKADELNVEEVTLENWKGQGPLSAKPA